MNRFGVLVAGGALALVAALPAAAQTEVTLGSFPMRVGDVVHLADERLVVTLDAILEDSRCPIDAFCIWAGRVVIALEVRIETKTGGETRRIELDTLHTPAEAGGVQFEIVTMKPSRQQVETIEPADYVFLISADPA